MAYVSENIDDIYWAWEELYKMYWMIMPPSNAEKSGKSSVDQNLSPQKYVKPLVTGMPSSINITSQERLATGRPTGSCIIVFVTILWLW